MLHWLTHNTNGKWQASSLQVPGYSLLRVGTKWVRKLFTLPGFIWLSDHRPRLRNGQSSKGLLQAWLLTQHEDDSKYFFRLNFQEYTCISLLIFGTVPIGKFGNTFVNLFLKLGKKWNLEIGKSDQLSQEFGGVHAMCCLDHIHLLALPLI